MKTLHLGRVAVLLGTVLVLGAIRAVAGDKEVKLTDLEPSSTEFGMIEDSPAEWNLAKGPGVVDLGTWGGRQGFPWADNRKIVKKVDPAYTLPEGQPYSSQMMDVFAVEGEFKTGVGLWCRTNCQYHWLEYEIPADAKKFQAKFYTTDDVAGANFHVLGSGAVPNQDFNLKILIDGQEVEKKHFQRLQVSMGSGTLVWEVDLDIPKGAKTIRFYMESSAFPDNIQNEVVINDGKFVF